MSYSNWYKKELSNIEAVRNQTKDYHNTLDKPLDRADIDKKVYLPHKYAAKEGQTWQSYIEELKIHKKYVEEKNIATHINGPRGSWYTHRSSASCFMCEDIDFINVIYQAMVLMAKQYPKAIF